jgi:SAM-dependent methyltransferase
MAVILIDRRREASRGIVVLDWGCQLGGIGDAPAPEIRQGGRPGMRHLTMTKLKRTAAHYEILMVPALFAPWSKRVLEIVEFQPEHRLVDIACGTGILARTAVQHSAGSRVSVAGLDANPGMLWVARGLAPQVDWHEGLAEDLPFEDNAFDIVVSQFGLMHFDDKPAALQEMQRILAPGGRLAVAVFDELEKTPGYRVMTELLDDIAGPDVAAAMRVPFSLGDANELGELCTEAGLSDAEITTYQGTARFPDARTMVLADVKGWFPLAGISLTDDQVDEIIQRLDSALEDYRAEDGSIGFPLPAHVVRLNG